MYNIIYNFIHLCQGHKYYYYYFRLSRLQQSKNKFWIMKLEKRYYPARELSAWIRDLGSRNGRQYVAYPALPRSQIVLEVTRLRSPVASGWQLHCLKFTRLQTKQLGLYLCRPNPTCQWFRAPYYYYSSLQVIAYHTLRSNENRNLSNFIRHYN